MDVLPTDEELVRQVQRGDDAAFGLIMKRYTAKLLRYGERVLSKENNVGDIVQDVFVTVYRNIKDFDSTRHFSPWIYRIAHNAFVDVIRKNSKGSLYFFDLDTVVPHPAYHDPVIQEKENGDISVLLAEGLDKLSPSYREIIDLYYYEDFSYRQIADILHIPIGTVGIRLSRAKRELRNIVYKEDHE